MQRCAPSKHYQLRPTLEPGHEKLATCAWNVAPVVLDEATRLVWKKAKLH